MGLSGLERGPKTGLSNKLTAASCVEKWLPGIKVCSLYNKNLDDPCNKPPLVNLEAGQWEYAAAKCFESTVVADKNLIYANECSVQLMITCWFNQASNLTGSRSVQFSEEKDAATDAIWFFFEEKEALSGQGQVRGGSDSPGVDRKKTGSLTKQVTHAGEGRGEENQNNQGTLGEGKVIHAVVHELPIRVPTKCSGKQKNCYLELAEQIKCWLRKTGCEAKLESIDGDLSTEKQLVKEVVGFGLANMKTVWGTSLQDDMSKVSCSNLAVDATGGIRGAWFCPKAACDPNHVEQVKAEVFVTPYLQMLDIPHANSNPSKVARIKAGRDFIKGFQLVLSATMPEIVSASPAEIARRLGIESVSVAREAIAAISEAKRAKTLEDQKAKQKDSFAWQASALFAIVINKACC
jgi:hypothetical protein